MKQRISLGDLSGLSESQRQEINDLWIPAIYDVAVARVCKDVENEEYDDVVFVVGGIELYNKTNMILHDIKHISKEQEAESSQDIELEAENNSPQPFDDLNSATQAHSVTIDSFPPISSDHFGEALGSMAAAINDDEGEEDVEFEEDDSAFDFSYTQPTSFNKEECIPLLTIGQLIYMIKKKGFGYGDFYISAGINEVGCEIGKGSFDINNYGFECDKNELCDVLWEYLKSILQ